MVASLVPDQLKRFEIPGRITVLEGNGELPKVEVQTDWSTAEIYLHGAHLTDFQKHKEAPLIFTSQFSRFTAGTPIRGGIPVIFPWFGPREGVAMHGFARVTNWELHEAITIPEGGASLRFFMPDTPAGATWTPFHAVYVVTITDKLTLELIMTNTAASETLHLENCLHTYFAVGDISQVSIRGLKGASYLDKTDNFARKVEAAEALNITGETDRIYLDTTSTVEILDPVLKRTITIEKSGSASTVVWNPGPIRSQNMPDFGNEEYQGMLCVESGNVASNKLSLAPGKSAVLKVVLSTQLW